MKLSVKLCLRLLGFRYTILLYLILMSACSYRVCTYVYKFLGYVSRRIVFVCGCISSFLSAGLEYSHIE